MEEHSLSILIPTYARTAWLEEALWCAIHQTVPVPVIVLNDCPRQTLSCDHPLVTVYNYEHRLATLGAKRNELLHLAKTEWVCWLDDDDWLLPWYVEELQRLFQPGLDGVLTTRCWHPIGGCRDGDVWWQEGVSAMSMAVRLRLARECRFSDELDSAEDQNFRHQLLTRGRLCSLSHISGYCYRWDNGVFHLSGKKSPHPGTEFQYDGEARLDNGNEPCGRICLSPSLRHNYFDQFPGGGSTQDPRLFWSIPIDVQERKTYALLELSLTVVFPSEIRQIIDFLFDDLPRLKEQAETPELLITCDPGTGRYGLSAPGTDEKSGILSADLAQQLLAYVLSWLTTHVTGGIALNAAAISRGNSAVLLPGIAGIGKTATMAWLLGKEFHFLSDKIVVVNDGRQPILPLRFPISIKKELAALFGQFLQDEIACKTPLVSSTTELLPWCLLDGSASLVGDYYPALILFPEFRKGAELSLQAISAAEATMLLLATIVNARNLPLRGVPLAARICRTLPALQLVYGDPQQLTGCLDKMLGLVLDYRFTAQELHTLVAPFNRQKHLEELARVESRKWVNESTASIRSTVGHVYPVPPATPCRQKKKLTIGMATHDDYDGVYFSVQALRLYHREVIDEIELIVIDNHPDGPCANALKKLDSYAPNYRYIPEQQVAGTAVRDLIFREASGEYVLVIDSHVLIIPGALRRLLHYYSVQPRCRDLLQGPLLHDNLTNISTHFDTVWREGMLGTWQTDDRGLDEDGEPFEIPAQGLGLFSCKKEFWPGFNPRFRGFGGEEGYIHEKFRRAGGKTLCLPFLRWLHRFDRPLGLSYTNKWQDRLYNYLVGLDELHLNDSECRNHFADFLGKEVAQKFIGEAKWQIQSPFFYFDALYTWVGKTGMVAASATRKSLDNYAAGQRLGVFPAEHYPDDSEHRRLLAHRYLIETAQKRAYHTLLVIEEGTSFVEQTNHWLPKHIQKLDNTGWQVFLLGGCGMWVTGTDEIIQPATLISPQRLDRVLAIAYHQRAYEALLADLPRDAAAIPAWLNQYVTLENFLSIRTATYLATPSLVAAG